LLAERLLKVLDFSHKDEQYVIGFRETNVMRVYKKMNMVLISISLRFWYRNLFYVAMPISLWMLQVLRDLAKLPILSKLL
jgi:hypothetical protein